MRSRAHGENGKFRCKEITDYKGIVSLGQMFGKWRVTSEVPVLKGSRRRLYIQCDDGYSEELVSYENLIRGKSTRSKRYPRTEIDNYALLRRRWEAMMSRCFDSGNPSYSRYGGRGITVSKEFQDCRTYCKYISELTKAGERE